MSATISRLFDKSKKYIPVRLQWKFHMFCAKFITRFSLFFFISWHQANMPTEIFTLTY